MKLLLPSELPGSAYKTGYQDPVIHAVKSLGWSQAWILPQQTGILR